MIADMKQTFFATGTKHKIDASGGSATEKFVVNAEWDFAIKGIVVSAYDQDGYIYDIGNRSDLLKIAFKTEQSRSDWQNEAFDLRHFLELHRSGGFPGMYLNKGTQLNITVSHEQVSPSAAFNFPLNVFVTFFGSYLLMRPNPEYAIWMRQQQQQFQPR
jgi:hypothetical protein